MSTAADGMEEIVQEFLAESAEGLDLLDHELVVMEREPPSRERLAEIFRAVHSLKGCSGMLGYPTLESVAHAGESLLGGLREGNLVLNPAVIGGLFAMVDALRTLLKAIEVTGDEGDEDYRVLIGSLEELLSNPSPSPPVWNRVLSGAPDTGDQDRRSENGAAGSKIHVDAALLDRMMDLAGELILARNQALSLIASQKDRALHGVAQRLKRATTDMQEAVMKARLRPIGSLWNKFPRLARDLALSCGKQVMVEMEGAETELDRAMVEAVKDPMTHILRNAIDHGIEVPEQRIAAGKPAAGRLRFRAFHREGSVHIEVSDDGAGINLPGVRRRALQAGLITAEQAAGMSEQQLATLVFTRGFSTSEKVTNVSGRGVGLDVVKTNVERIGGAIDLHSVTGQGTTVHIKLPLTLAILPALIVSSGGQRFAIPQVNLAGVVHRGAGLEENPMETVCGAPVCRLRDRLLPVCVLQRELRLGGKPPDGPYIVVVQARADQFGLVVDAVHDTEEIVVKPLGRHLRAIACFAGAAVLGDGQVALILDVVGLAHLAGVRARSQVTPPSEGVPQNGGGPPEEAPSWLVFRGTTGSRFALPLSAVARLEEIPADRIEHSAGREVLQHGGEIMPLLRAARLFHEPEQARESLQVAVLRESGRNTGLVLDRIEDIVAEVVELHAGPPDGLLRGPAIIQGRVVDVLNLKNVLARAQVLSNIPALDRRG